MLNKVKVQGYQALKDVELELGRFTVIVGESNVGKSSFVRAIRAIVNNEPGVSYITKGHRFAQITLWKDGEPLEWKKSKSAEYRLGDATFSKIGTSVPEDVADFLAMGEIDLGNGIKFDPNFHNQFSIPFLLDESAPRVAKILGELSGVNILYMATQVANSEARKATQSLTRLREELEIKKEQAAALLHIKRRSGLFATAGSILGELEEKIQRLKFMRQYLSRIEAATVRVETARVTRHHFEPVSGVDIECVGEKVADARRIRDVLRRLKEAISNKESSGRRLKPTCDDLQAKEVALQEFMDKLGVCPLCEQQIGGSDASGSVRRNHQCT